MVRACVARHRTNRFASGEPYCRVHNNALRYIDWHGSRDCTRPLSGQVQERHRGSDLPSSHYSRDRSWLRDGGSLRRRWFRVWTEYDHRRTRRVFDLLRRVYRESEARQSRSGTRRSGARPRRNAIADIPRGHVAFDFASGHIGGASGVHPFPGRLCHHEFRLRSRQRDIASQNLLDG